MKKNILFDLDGTLTDPAPGITGSVRYALEKLGAPVPPQEVLCRFIGPPLLESFSTYCGFSAQQSRAAIEYYREYFAQRGLFENRVYDGISQLLRALTDAKRRLFIATGKPEVFARQIAAHFGFDSYFEDIAGIPLDGEHLSKSLVIARVVGSYGLDPLATVMVGDRSYDAVGAAENGIDCVGVLYGYGTREEFPTGTPLCGSVAELVRYLLD